MCDVGCSLNDTDASKLEERMKNYIIAALLLFSITAYAQDQTKQVSAHELAIQGKLNEELNLEMQVREALIVEQQKNKDLQAELDKLKAANK
jgi:hypothetical protein